MRDPTMLKPKLQRIHFLSGLVVSMIVVTCHGLVFFYVVHLKSEHTPPDSGQMSPVNAGHLKHAHQAQKVSDIVVKRFRQELLQNTLDRDPEIWIPRIKMCLTMDEPAFMDFWKRHLDYFFKISTLKDRWHDTGLPILSRFEIVAELKSHIGENHPYNALIRQWVMQHRALIRNAFIQRETQQNNKTLSS